MLAFFFFFFPSSPLSEPAPERGPWLIPAHRLDDRSREEQRVASRNAKGADLRALAALWVCGGVDGEAVAMLVRRAIDDPDPAVRHTLGTAVNLHRSQSAKRFRRLSWARWQAVRRPGRLSVRDLGSYVLGDSDTEVALEIESRAAAQDVEQRQECANAVRLARLRRRGERRRVAPTARGAELEDLAAAWVLGEIDDRDVEEELARRARRDEDDDARRLLSESKEILAARERATGSAPHSPHSPVVQAQSLPVEREPSRQRPTRLAERVRAWLDSSPGVHTYGDVAAAIGLGRAGARAVGAAMRALHAEGAHEYCPKVVAAATGKPGFACSLSRENDDDTSRRS